MPLDFSDLIPQQGAKLGTMATPKSSGVPGDVSLKGPNLDFSDLIPQAQQSPPMSGTVPVLKFLMR
jgi:hypothetical protein